MEEFNMRNPLYKISGIEKNYSNWYAPNHDLSYDDQKWIWENVPLPEEDERKLRESRTNESVSLNGSVNGGYKSELNLKSNLSKVNALFLLNKCSWKTPPKKVATYLTIIFSKWPSRDGHWLYIAQHYTPKTINSRIAQIVKQHQKGEVNIQNSAAYFTKIIKYRPMRKKFRSTNGGPK